MSDASEMLSIVVPCYNDAPCLEPFVAAIDALDLPVARELIFIDDGSVDGTLDALRAYARRRHDIRYVAFSRNFGKDAALLAGLRTARGD